MLPAVPLYALETEHDPPVAPIHPEATAPDVWTLRTAAISVAVDARRAFLIGLAPAGSSNLLASPVSSPSSPGRNSPAGWIWPVPESAWASLRAQGRWPEVVFNSPAWTGRAWRTRSGAAFCRWHREFDAPLCARATRTIRVSPYTASLEIEDRWERTGDTSVPLGPATVFRFANPVRVLLPAREDGVLVRPIAFAPPPAFAWRVIADVWTYRTDLGGEHRVESLAEDRPWAAVEVPGWLVLLRATPRPTPDRVRFHSRAYVHRAARVAEIELVAEGAELPAGTVLVSSTLMECLPLAPRSSAETLATRVRLLAGEPDTPSPQ